MTAENRRTRPGIHWFRRFCRDERGAVLVFVAVALVPMLASVGLAVDGGRAYIVRSELSRAVDAACLAAAKSLRQGRPAATQEAFAVAAANGVVNGSNGVSLSITFGSNADGEQTVGVGASRPVPVYFMRVLGWDRVNVVTAAEATVPPVDLTLVLDKSGSLGQQGAWVPLQNAARQFVGFFDDNIDQLGLVSFQVRANDEFLIQHGFKVPINVAINRMNSVGDTNTGEGLRLAFDQMHAPNVRPMASRVVVFFTDGRPTALRGDVLGRDRAIAVSTIQTGWVRGYFNNPAHIPMHQLANPNGCRSVVDCGGWTENGVRNQARQNGITQADRLRGDGILVYTIGLGNPGANNPLLVPDLAYLRLLANENGISNPAQPQGKSYFAPSSADLQAVFQQVAQDLLVRLSR